MWNSNLHITLVFYHTIYHNTLAIMTVHGIGSQPYTVIALTGDFGCNIDTILIDIQAGRSIFQCAVWIVERNCSIATERRDY